MLSASVCPSVHENGKGKRMGEEHVKCALCGCLWIPENILRVISITNMFVALMVEESGLETGEQFVM